MDLQILKVLVGSQAHGLATQESDFDYRGVYIAPTSEILRIGGEVHDTSWIEGKEDNTSWEVGHFLKMATKSNPTILETFLSPVEETDFWGIELRALFPHVWNSSDVVNAFIGYGQNQRKKFLDEKDARPPKYAAANARVLYNAYELLTTGTFTIRIADTPVGETVRKFKEGKFKFGEVIDFCREWEQKVREAYKENPNKETNLEAVNEFLLKVRKHNW
jgi:predicted nucleotidyltransferase